MLTASYLNPTTYEPTQKHEERKNKILKNREFVMRTEIPSMLQKFLIYQNSKQLESNDGYMNF